jgi:hypothetical protein
MCIVNPDAIRRQSPSRSFSHDRTPDVSCIDGPAIFLPCSNDGIGGERDEMADIQLVLDLLDQAAAATQGRGHYRLAGRLVSLKARLVRLQREVVML